MNIYFVDGNDKKTCDLYNNNKEKNRIVSIILRGNGFKKNKEWFEENEYKDIDVYTNDEKAMECGWNEDDTKLNLWFYYDELGFVHKDYVYQNLRPLNDLDVMFRAGLFDLEEEDIERIKNLLEKEKKNNGM